MKRKSLIAVLLLLMAGVQTAWTQSMKVTLSGNRTVWYNTSDVASVTFSNNGASDGYEYVDLGLPSGTVRKR